VAKVKANPNSTTPESNYHYCGYIGGDDDDIGYGIAVDSSDCAYVTGYTKSGNTSFPVAVGPDTSYNGDCDAFVAKVKANPNSTTPESNYHYCGYIGGDDDDIGYDIAVDGSGCAYVTGGTDSENTTFPETVGPDLSYNGGDESEPFSGDIFVAKVKANPNSTTPESNYHYCGYMGGNDDDEGRGIAVDGSGCAYVTGVTCSDGFDEGFPAIVRPELTSNGDSNAFVVMVCEIEPCATVAAATGTGNAIFCASSGTMGNLTAVSESTLSCPGAGKPNLEFTHGFFSFNITILEYYGEEVTITITLPQAIPVGTEYWKCQNNTWVDVTSLLGDDDGDNVLTLKITDGGLGDADGEENGVIEEPGAPGQPGRELIVGGEVYPVNKLHILAPWLGLAAFIVLSMSVIVITQRKRQT
jgi:hypothetical protein